MVRPVSLTVFVNKIFDLIVNLYLCYIKMKIYSD